MKWKYLIEHLQQCQAHVDPLPTAYLLTPTPDWTLPDPPGAHCRPGAP